MQVMDPNISSKIAGFFTQFKKIVYKKGELLIRADEAPSGIFYLKEGMIKEYTISQKGEELVVNMFKPISFFPMSWAINQTPNSYYFEALTDTECYLAPREVTVEFIKNNPDVLYNLLSRVYKGTDGLLTRLTYLMSGSAYTRLITELIIHTRRFASQDSQGRYEIKITERDLAAQTGMSRETISRELRILKDKEIVTFSKSLLIINNLDLLEKELTADI